MISIIIPFYNEAESLPVLINQLIDTCRKLKQSWEIVLVDDGSVDAGASKLKVKSPAFAKASAGKEKLKVISHKKRLGKGKALNSGYQASRGEIIVFMDADLQDDPKELPKFVDAVNKGYDLVNGWRADRKDPFSKKAHSYIFNTLLLKFFFKSKFHDINCGYKAMRRKVLEEIPLYGDNYRFLPIMAEQAGFKTTELVIRHHARRFGKSKYGFLRLLLGLFDTVTTYFVYKFSEKPLHFFGPIGGLLFIAGSVITVYLSIGRIFFHRELYRRPLLLFGILLIIVGIQIVMTGVIAELIVYLNKRVKSS